MKRYVKKINGFTLIELLAIIVILAIIAVITVPIILNVIDNAKRGTAIDSAYGYKDSISKYYVSSTLNKKDVYLDGDYSVNDKGELYDDIIIHQIAFTGESPKGGYFNFDNNKLIEGCLQINEYKVIFEDGEVKDAFKGECENNGDNPREVLKTDIQLVNN